MPDEQPHPPQRAWRNGGPAKAGASKGGPAWKRSPGDSISLQRQGWSRKTQLAIVGVLVAAVIGVLAWVFLWPRPVKPFRLVLLTAGYETNLAVPHNVPGRKTAAKLAKWARANPTLEVKEAPLAGDGSTLTEALDRCREPTVVVYLAAHGDGDDEGPYLIPHDADPRQPKQSRLRLTAVLDRLAQLPEKTRKLLILDATQVGACWPLGMFHNDFARKLQDLKPRIEEIPGLVVLSASGDDQRSWASEEWRQTIFGHHVLEGLRGAAEEGGRVNALKLYTYVKDKVKHWARHNRGALQEPVLLGGEERARTTELIAVEGRYQPPSLVQLERFKAPPELEKAWAECQELNKARPSPAVHTPHLWRQYLDTLVRYEQLLRADDRPSADTVLAEAATLHKKIVAARSRKLDSALNTLTMPAALGWGIPTSVDDKRAKEVQDLWAKPEEVRDRLAQWLAAEKDLWKKPLLRGRLGGLLLHRAADDPQANLKQVAALLAAPEEVSAPRTAEAHFAVMLARDLVKQPPWPLVKEALQLRRSAEEAALGLQPGEEPGALPPYSEQLSPSIRKRLDDADAERRPGEDLLFASRAEDWKKSGAYLAKAAALYKEAQAEALTLRQALRQRDEALTALPYYSQWLAGQRFLDAPQLSGFDQRVRDNLRLWDAVEKLDRAVQAPAPDAGPALAKLTKAVGDGFKELKKEFTDYSGKNYPILQENWHEIDGLLAVPFIPAARRLELLGKLRQISEELHLATEKAAGERGMTAEQTRLLAREGSRAQGKLALAALGEDAFKSAKGRVEFEEVKRAVWFSPDAVWKQELDRAGDEIARRWNLMPAALDEKVAASRKQDLEKAVATAREAAGLARRLPGAGVAWLTTDPLEEQRRLQLHDLLCRQAQRTSLDFWAAESAGLPPYYRAAGLVYVEDARAQLPADPAAAKQQQARLARAAALKKELEDEDRKPVVAWSLDGRRFKTGKTALSLTDEEELPLWYAVQAPETVPQGFPVLREELTGGASFLTAPADKDARHVQPRIGPDPVKDGPVLYPLTRRPRKDAPPLKEFARQVVHGLYRGHRPLSEAAVNHFAIPDLAPSLPAMPTMGRLAVQTPTEVFVRYAEGSGAVALVLDCSGSMRTPLPGGTTRFQEAVRALYQVLQAIPKGTQVSLWAFSHAVNLDTGRNMRNDDPEDTIQRVFFRKSWEATDDTMNRIRARVKALIPHNETPIVRSMMSAVEDFKDRRGFKNLVILTDGMDNRFENQRDGKWGGDPVLNPGGKLTIPQFLEKTFSTKPYKDVAIRIIGFQLPPGEEADSLRQFKAPLERLPTKGRFYLVGDTVDLIAKLKDSIKQRLFFTLEESSGQPVKGLKGGVDVSRQGTDSHWVDLKPGYYFVNLETTQLRQKVEIKRGDRLRLNLYQGSDGFVLQRDLVEKAFPGASYPKAKARDWLLTVLQNQKLQTEDAVQMMVTVENLRDREFGGEGTLGHVTPSLILFQVKPPADVKTPTSLRYRPLADYAAPSWGLEVRPWQRSAAPVLEAFWSENPPDNAAVLRKGRHFDDDLRVLPEGSEFEAQLTQKDRGAVRLLSLRTENHWVDTYDGKRKEVSCLVVRMTYPEGLPVMVQLPKWVGGQEHRFYTQAGKYTGIFWEMTPQQAREVVDTLNVISLQAFRDAAERSGQYARIELRAPNNDPRPPAQ